MKTSKPEPTWLDAERMERVGRFTLKGAAKEIFPLLCPVREYEWLSGWSCRMAWSESGVAEMDAIFHTREAAGRSAVWTLITFQPDRFIEYLIVSGRDVVVRLSVSLEEASANKTEVTWRMLFTSTSPLGRHVIHHAYSEAKFQKMMRSRESELNHFLATGKMLR